MDDQKRPGHDNITGERDDFIVITEFSEREGPISPLTIPTELPPKWHFNKSKFALRVLGSEFRKKKALGTLPSINVCDMQQFFEDDTNELYIYCHYCSIADFGARGYTRALCLTYITPTPKKIQRIFSWLKRVFTQTAMILKKAAQKTFLREMDEIINIINHKHISHTYEYNDLFQCHLNAENRKNILIDMNETRHSFGNKLLDKPAINTTDIDKQIVVLNRMRHRPHRVGKEGYKPLKQIVGKEDYNKFRDSLRNIHSQFHKNCLDIYVDIKNKELSHLNPNRLFAIGSLSCLDIEPCHYLSPSWNNDNDDSMKYLQNILNNNNVNKPSNLTAHLSPAFGPINSTHTNIPSSLHMHNKAHKSHVAIHPNLFLHQTEDEKQNQNQINTDKPIEKSNKSTKKRSPKILKITPSQHLCGRNYKKKKFLKLYDRKMQRIERKNCKIMSIQGQMSPQNINVIEHEPKSDNNNNNNVKDAEGVVTTNAKSTVNCDEQQALMNNIWENFIMTRNKCDLEVHKERKTKRKSEDKSEKVSNTEREKESGLAMEGLSTPKIKRRRSGSSGGICNGAHAEESRGRTIKARFRECSDRAREKNLSRCLLGRFRGFAESILFTILTNRTLVILANDVQKNKEKVEKTVRALSLLIPGVENTHSTQEWRDEILYCHQLPKLKIVGMSSELCNKSPDNIWDLITIIQFDDSILYGPPYKSSDENKSFIYKMLHPRKRFKTPNLFYRYLSRIMLEMSLHVFLFYYISQKTVINLAQNDVEPNAYYKALLETLQFTQSSDIDIAKHWCHIMQNQLYSLCKPITILRIDKNQNQNKKDIRKELLAKYGRRPPPIVRIT